MDSAIHRINHYPGDSVIDFRNTYPLDSAIQRLNNRGLTDKPEVDGALIFLRSTLTHLTDIKRYSKHGLCIAPPPNPLLRFFSEWRGWLVIGWSKLLVGTRKGKESKQRLEVTPWGMNWGILAREATHQPTAVILAPKGTVIQRMQQILR